MKNIKKISEIHKYLVEFSTKYPLILVLYAFVGIIFLLGGWLIIYIFVELIDSIYNNVPTFYIFILLVLFGLSLVIPIFFTTIISIVLFRYIAIPARKVIRILQVIFFTVISYSLTYYYLNLFLDGGALTNIAAHDSDLHTFWDKILYVPSIDLVVDCFYFSITTFSTIGYGDIHPATWISKLVVASEMMMGFLITVVSIGYLLSRNSNETNNANSADAKSRASD